MNFFINRPIFAAAIALMMILAGSICMLTLPISQYPPLVPPQIKVSTQYIGAGAEVVADTVTTPLEEQINGAEGMIYMSSASTNNGDSVITITFEVGYDQDIAQMDVLTRCNQALSELPPEVNQVGLTIEKNSSNILLSVNLVSPDGSFDSQFLQNYADIHIADTLSRIPGVASLLNAGLRKYAMRIWLNPEKLNNMGLTATDVVNAVKEQNQQVAAGALGQAPAPGSQAFQYQLSTLGRLGQVSQFEDIIIRARPEGDIVRIKDVGTVDLGAEEYNWSTSLNNKATATLLVFQLANANGLDIKEKVIEAMTELEKNFPKGMEWTICYDTTSFIHASIKEVVITLIEAISLVVLVVFIFLQNPRATIIPTIAVPVSLIGTFAFMALLGFSINILSLLGLVLAVALVVDDAIVVVENVMRKLEERGGGDLRAITSEALAEVRGPIIATTLVLMAVFVPVSFIPGMTGMLYNQFSLTIAISVGLSGINSLTLSPALCAVFLKKSKPSSTGFILFRLFNGAFAKLADFYGLSVRAMIRVWPLALLVFLGLCVLTGFLLYFTPTGFVPSEDQGYVIVVAELPEAASITRTQKVMHDVAEITLKHPGVENVLSISGYNIIDSIQQPYAGVSFVVLKPWDERTDPETQLPALMATLQAKYAEIEDAVVMVANAPSIPGLGATGGFTLEIEDLNGAGIGPLSKVVDHFIDEARRRPELTGIYTTYTANCPQKFVDVDRVKAKTMQVSLDELFATLQINLGSMYVNEFNKFGRIYRVYAQAEDAARMDVDDIKHLKVRNKSGQMVNLDVLFSTRDIVGPYNIPHYNEYDAIAVNGANAPGFSSGQAIKAIEKLADEILPEGFGRNWTNITYQQLKAGNLAPVIFALSLVFVFLVLAAQYESWGMPFMVLLGVPLGLLGAVILLLARNMELDVYGQIGLVMLIGLTAKNAILIIEFARGLRNEGATIIDAAVTAAKIRLRPILMTALAFIIGLMPLVVASGAGAKSRQSLGTTVVGGLALATALITFVPLFYYLIENLREKSVFGVGKAKNSEPGKDATREVVKDGK